MQSIEISYELLRKNCSDESFHCYGMRYIFDKKAFKFGRWLNLLKVFGILTPAMVGITALSYEYEQHKALISTSISVAIVILIIQFGFSVLAVIYKWDDELAYAFEASQDYSELHDNFRRLAEFPPSDLVHLQNSYEILNTNTKRANNKIQSITFKNGNLDEE